MGGWGWGGERGTECRSVASTHTVCTLYIEISIIISLSHQLSVSDRMTDEMVVQYRTDVIA